MIPKRLSALIAVLTFFVGFWLGFNTVGGDSMPPPRRSAVARAPDPVPAGPRLELNAFSWSRAGGGMFAIAEGMVTNISDEPIANVEAVAIFDDSEGGFITSESALIDYTPLLPGQSSPFQVGATWNPAMHAARVEFKELMGGQIRVRDGR